MNLQPDGDEEGEEAENQVSTWEKAVGEIESKMGKVLSIPGNHDPMSMFTELKDSNIHGKSYMLAENLKIIGLGGCVQNFVQKSTNGPLEKCWSPYPYTEENHSRFEKEL